MKANNSIEKPEWELIGRYLTGEATTAEIKEIEDWAAASEQNQHELEQSRQLLQHADAIYALRKFDTDIAWKSVRKQVSRTAPVLPFAAAGKKATAVFYRYAAAVLIAVLLGSAGYLILSNSTGNPRITEVTASEYQVVSEYILPDGSAVTLNSNSTLHFPVKFTGGFREVAVTGEAFFDVKPDASRPFVINAGDARIRVLGTSFNVNAYPDAESVEVIVETGVVQVVCCEGEESEQESRLLLNAGERGILLKSARKLDKTLNTDRNYLAWKTHYMVFEKTPLNQVIQTLEKVYRTNIELEDIALENLLLTAQFEEKPAEFILDVIRLTFDLELKKQNETYILSDKTALNN